MTRKAPARTILIRLTLGSLEGCHPNRARTDFIVNQSPEGHTRLRQSAKTGVCAEQWSSAVPSIRTVVIYLTSPESIASLIDLNRIDRIASWRLILWCTYLQFSCLPNTWSGWPDRPLYSVIENGQSSTIRSSGATRSIELAKFTTLRTGKL